MAQIPVYRSNVRARPISGQNFNVRANAEQFGAAIGRGLQQFSAGIGQLGQTFEAIEDFDATIEAKEADNQYSDWLRERMYGDGGYLTLQGGRAVKEYDNFAKDVESYRDKLAENLNPRAAAKFKRASVDRINSTLNRAITHKANQRKQWAVSAANARLELFANEAISEYNNPLKVAQSLQSGLDELAEQAIALGWSEEELKLKSLEYASDVHSNVVAALAQDSAITAQDYLEANKAQFTTTDYIRLEAKLRDAVLDEQASITAGLILDGSYNSNSDDVKMLEDLGAGRVEDELAVNLSALIKSAPEEIRQELTFKNGLVFNDLSPQAQEWLELNAKKFNIDVVDNYVIKQGSGISNFALLPDIDSIENQIASIKDPELRERVIQRIEAARKIQEDALEKTRKAAQEQLFDLMVQGYSPDEVPIEIKRLAGMKALSSAWTFYEKQGQVDSDQELLYQLRLASAQDPERFAQIDLVEFMDRLSQSDLKELTKQQMEYFSDKRKAKQDNISLATAFSLAKTSLDAAGFSTTGLKGSRREEVLKKRAEFNNALVDEIAVFKQKNERNPNQIELQDMINKLLLPVVFEEKGFLGLPKKEEGFLFETRLMRDEQSVDIVVDYNDIPIDLRNEITIRLRDELGRAPTKEEVTNRYEEFVLR